MSSMDFQNPYFRLPLTFDPAHFYGSRMVVRFILERISAPTPGALALLGLPGMGKSTLLRYLSDPQGALARESDALQPVFQTQPEAIFPVLVQFRLKPTDMHAFLFLYSSFHERYQDYRRRVQAVAGQPLPELVGQPDVQDVAAALAGLEHDTHLLAQRGVRLALLLDDFDLPFEKLTADETTRLRPLREWLAFVLGTERRLDQVNRAAWGSPFFQTLPHVSLGGLTREESLRLVREPAELAGHPFPEADVGFVFEQANGHAYLLILGARALWDLRRNLDLLEQASIPLSGEQRSMLRGRLFEDFRGSFQMYWDRLESGEQDALRASTGTAEFTDRQLAALASLAEKGLVTSEARRERYAPFSDLLREFVEGMAQAVELRPELRLTGMESNVYEYLRQHPDRICTFEELWREVWKGSPEEAHRGDITIRRPMQVTLSRLRAKLQAATEEDIVSVRGQGYRFVPRA